jgi:hypothetical protein
MIPTISGTLSIERLDEFLLEFAEHDKEISVGVAATGDAAAYAEVWEWGSARQTKPGPKTVLGTNPSGEQVWLSIQAPFGFVSIHENDFWDALSQELERAKFSSTNPKDITTEIQKAGVRAMKLCKQLLQDSAPVDTGQLRDSFQVIEDGDPILDDVDDTKTLVLG